MTHNTEQGVKPTEDSERKGERWKTNTLGLGVNTIASNGDVMNWCSLINSQQHSG